MSVEVGSAVGYLDLDIRGFLDGLRSAQEAASESVEKIQKGFGERISDIGDSISGIGKSFAAISLPVAGFGALITKFGSDFQKEMLNIKAITGMSAEEMDRFKNVIYDVGKSSGISVKEVASAAKMIAESGGDMGKMQEQLAHGANLARATQTDLATTLDIVGSSMKTFGIETEDTQKVVDSLAQVTRLANTTLTDINQAYVNVGGSAKQAGLSMDDVNAILVTFSNAGLKGGAAGTSLNRMLMDLKVPTDKAVEALDALGVSLYKNVYSSTDLKNVQKELDSLLKDQEILLKEAEKALGYVEKAQNELANAQKKYNDELEKTSLLVSSALSAEANLKKAKEAYSDAIEKFGENSEQAIKTQEQLDIAQKKYNAAVVELGPNYIEAMNAQEKLTDAKDNYNAAVVEFGFNSYQALKAQELLTEAQDEYKSVILDSGSAFEQFDNARQGLEESSRKLTDAEEAYQDALQSTEENIWHINKAQEELAYMMSVNTGEARDMLDIMEDLQEALSGLSDEERNAAESAIFSTVSLKGWQNIAEAGVSTIRELSSEFGLASEEFEGLGVSAGMTAIQNEGLENSYTRLSNSLTEFGEVVDKIQPWMEWMIDCVESLVDWFKNLDESTQNIIIGFGVFVGAITPVTLALGGLITSIGNIYTLLGTLSTAIGLTTAAKATWGFTTTVLSGILEGFVAGLKGLWIGAVEGYKLAVVGLTAAKTGLSTFITTTLIPAITRFAFTTIPSTVTALGTMAVAAGTTAVTALGSFVATIWAAAIPACAAFWTALTGPIGLAIIAIAAIGAAIWYFWDDIVEIGKGFGILLSDAGEWLWDLGASILKWCGDVLSNIGKFFSDVWKTITSWTSKAWEIGKNIIMGIWDGIQKQASWFRDQIYNFFSSIMPQWVRDALGIKSPSKLFADIGQWLPRGLAEGFEDAMPLAIKNMQSALDAGIGLLQAQDVEFDYGFAPAKSRSGGGGGWDGSGFGSSGQQNTGGNTYIFQSPEPIDAAAARRELEALNRRQAFGF